MSDLAPSDDPVDEAIADLAHHETGEKLIEILRNHCGERGDSEGAVETLQRILRERDIRGPETIVKAELYRKVLDRLVRLADADFNEGIVDTLDRILHERDVLMNQWPAGVNGNALMMRLKDFVADLVRVKPSLEDGEAVSVEFVGGRVHSDQDHDLYSFSVETKRIENGF